MKYNTEKGQFVVSEEKRRELERNKVDFSEFQNTAQQIERDVRLRPFEYKQPICRRIGFRLLSIFCVLVYLYVTLLIVQMALFNLVVLGVVIVYLTRLVTLLHAFEFNQDHAYRTRPFKRFIEQENERYYRKDKQVELIGGDMGKWLEVQFKETLEDKGQTDNIERKLMGGSAKVINEEK